METNYINWHQITQSFVCPKLFDKDRTQSAVYLLEEGVWPCWVEPGGEWTSTSVIWVTSGTLPLQITCAESEIQKQSELCDQDIKTIINWCKHSVALMFTSVKISHSLCSVQVNAEDVIKKRWCFCHRSRETCAQKH